MDRIRDVDIQRLVRSRQPVDPSLLADPDVPLARVAAGQ